MIKGFKEDLEIGKVGEEIALRAISFLSPSGSKVEDVSGLRDCRYKGDIRLTLPTGEVYYIEVKNDSRIAESGNVLCEEEVYYKDSDYFSKGNMYCSSDILAVVSSTENKIYFFDFPTVKKNYKAGEFKLIRHYAQDTYCYLVRLSHLKKWGALIREFNTLVMDF